MFLSVRSPHEKSIIINSDHISTIEESDEHYEVVIYMNNEHKIECYGQLDDFIDQLKAKDVLDTVKRECYMYLQTLMNTLDRTPLENRCKAISIFWENEAPEIENKQVKEIVRNYCEKRSDLIMKKLRVYGGKDNV